MDHIHKNECETFFISALASVCQLATLSVSFVLVAFDSERERDVAKE